MFTSCFHINVTSAIGKTLDLLDKRKDWQFLVILYVARWLTLTPLILLYSVWPLGFSDHDWADTKLSAGLLLFAFFLDPCFETLIECALPYRILRRFIQSEQRPWLYVGISALTMMALHPYLGSLLPAFITGAFLAYTYAHFAPRNKALAFTYTMLFHTCINLGITLLRAAGLRF